jgi:hypothetical protein
VAAWGDAKRRRESERLQGSASTRLGSLAHLSVEGHEAFARERAPGRACHSACGERGRGSDGRGGLVVRVVEPVHCREEGGKQLSAMRARRPRDSPWRGS